MKIKGIKKDRSRGTVNSLKSKLMESYLINCNSTMSQGSLQSNQASRRKIPDLKSREIKRLV
ncbi:hypothetical protein M3M39_05050 [Fructilactobacillus hinvesii]|uniref:Uncharacterized protein n=1 Tax=Fructilactobacillus hinvesii TaxID=2940300 RepID=A0ABY5BSC6_9LACO|nr:hypothetical protein [Fructilactobacillus hinvesii]USS87491.1 hypothetical protein M3M39_05050 [Fructilactobacillus hinvesii]